MMMMMMIADNQFFNFSVTAQRKIKNQKSKFPNFFLFFHIIICSFLKTLIGYKEKDKKNLCFVSFLIRSWYFEENISKMSIKVTKGQEMVLTSKIFMQKVP